MFCPNCGRQIEKDAKQCTECGVQLVQDTPIDEKKTEEAVPKKKTSLEEMVNTQEYNTEKMLAAMEDNTPNILCIISLICLMVSPFLGYISILLTCFFDIAAMTIVIFVRVKYPTNIFGRVLMILYTIGAILVIVNFIIFIIMCTSAIRNCRPLP